MFIDDSFKFVAIEYVALVVASCLATGYLLLFLKLKLLLSWSQGMW